MTRKYTRIPAKTFEQLQLNAGVVTRNFDPSKGTVEEDDILFATTGGVSFTENPSYTDLGEDIDNCPKNTKELKILDSIEVKLSGTALTATPEIAARLAGAADVDSTDKTKVVPRNDLQQGDFGDTWWVGDYGTGGFVALKLINALSTGGFQLQSTDKGKGQLAFEFTGHYSLADQDKVPYEIYISDGATTAA